MIGRSSGLYSIDGYIGMMDRNFEEIWQAKNGQVPNGFCLLLNVANFRDLHSNSYIDPDDTEGSVARFESSLELLFQLAPKDTNEFRNAFMSGGLLGKPTTSFRPLAALGGLTDKYEALRSYLVEG